MLDWTDTNVPEVSRAHIGNSQAVSWNVTYHITVCHTVQKWRAEIPATRIPGSQRGKIFSMSVKLGFQLPQPKIEIYNSWIEQKNCLPSRDRTAGLKIPDYPVRSREGSNAVTVLRSSSWAKESWWAELLTWWYTVETYKIYTIATYACQRYTCTWWTLETIAKIDSLELVFKWLEYRYPLQ